MLLGARGSTCRWLGRKMGGRRWGRCQCLGEGGGARRADRAKGFTESVRCRREGWNVCALVKRIYSCYTNLRTFDKQTRKKNTRGTHTLLQIHFKEVICIPLENFICIHKKVVHRRGGTWSRGVMRWHGKNPQRSQPYFHGCAENAGEKICFSEG